MSSADQMRIAYIVISGLVVCSMLAVALATIDLSSFWGDGEQDVIVDPNADLIAEQQTAVAGNPEDVDQVVLLANLLANTGRMTEATDWYQRALELAPDDNSIRLDFARSLQANNMVQDAEAQFLRVLENDTSSLSGHYYLAKLYMDWQPQRRADAQVHFERVLEINPDSFLGEQARNELDTFGRATPTGSPGATGP
jgi:cytochrome c-type biogenesis protein CcmH/NrfG